MFLFLLQHNTTKRYYIELSHFELHLLHMAELPAMYVPYALYMVNS